MAYSDLRHFIQVLEEKNLLKRITTEVDADLEITEITDRVSKAHGPALLFENVKGHDIPVLINAFGSFERMKLALEVDNFDSIGNELLWFINEKLPSGIMGKFKAIPKLKRMASFIPRRVKDAPCKEVIIKNKEEIKLSKFPILKCWPEDAGKFITLPLVMTKDPYTGYKNLGMYRLQVYDERTTGMHWHRHKDGASNYKFHEEQGKRIEVAVCLGCDPALIYSATAPLPKGLGEVFFAGFLRGKSVEVIPCETVDLDIPANSEIVLEGYVPPRERRREGPFGDHTGYYSLADDYPVFHITCITHRRNPIYPTTIVGKPPMEDCYMAKATERIFLPLMKLSLPEIVDMNLPMEGVFHNLVVVSIKKKYPGHAQKVMSAIWGMGQMMFTKMIIVVDDDVNVQDMSEVWWKVGNNIAPRRDVMFVDGPLDILDHASPYPDFGSKMGIDATKKWKNEAGHTREWPNQIVMEDKIKKMVDEKWEKYGLPG